VKAEKIYSEQEREPATLKQLRKSGNPKSNDVSLGGVLKALEFENARSRGHRLGRDLLNQRTAISIFITS